MSDDGLDQGFQYVTAELERGVSQEEIRKQLLASGWSVEDIETVIRRANHGGNLQPEYTEPETYASSYASGQSIENASASPWQSPTAEPNQSFGPSDQSYAPANNNPSWNPKAFFFFLGGALSFLVAIGVVFAVAAGMINGRSIRFIVGLILFGGWLWKKGAEARNDSAKS